MTDLILHFLWIGSILPTNCKQLHLRRCKKHDSQPREITLLHRQVASYTCKENKCHVQGKTSLANTSIFFFSVETLMGALPELLYGLASKWREDISVDQRRSQPDAVRSMLTGLFICTTCRLSQNTCRDIHFVYMQTTISIFPAGNTSCLCLYCIQQ